MEISGNQVNWTASGGYSNGFYADGSCGNVSEYNNNWNAGIGPGIW